MRLSILAIGTLKKAPEAPVYDDYARRIAHQGRAIGITDLRCKEFAEARHTRAADRRADESTRLLAASPEQAAIIALSERGHNRTSAEFAGIMQRHLDRGTTELAFLIGGPDGHDTSLEDAAADLLAFGAMTWPHRLARVMLAEQVYRAVTILTNHPYHRA